MNCRQFIMWKMEKKPAALRRQAAKLLILFLIFMLLFTVLSRTAANIITPTVVLSSPERGSLSFDISAAGAIEETRIQAVNVLVGIRVKNVFVKEGDHVSAQDALLELDTFDIGEKIAQKKRELQKLTLQIEDINKQRAKLQDEAVLAAQRAKEDYEKAQQHANIRIERAKQDLAAAQSRLAQLAPLPPESSEEEQAMKLQEKAALEEACYQAQRALEDTVTAVENDLAAALRQVEDTLDTPLSVSSSASMELDRQVLEQELSRIQELADQAGIIPSPIDGTVQKLTVETGGTTSDSMAAAVSDASAGGVFTAQIPVEQQAYVTPGDIVSLTSTNGRKKAEGLVITSIRENKEDEQMLDVVVPVSGEQMELGDTAVMNLKKSSREYGCTVPVDALRTDEQGYFVLVIEESQGILGSEFYAVKINVTVLEKNRSTAALDEGMLGSKSLVIVSSDKPIEAGSRVRLEEQ